MNFAAIAIIAIAFVFQAVISKTRFSAQKNGFLIFLASFLLIFGDAFLSSYRQYHLWKGDVLTKGFLPPYQNFNYFIYYARYHFFDSYLLSLSMGILFFVGAEYLNRKYNGRFFETIEPYLLLTALFLSGTPGWLVYLVVFLALFLMLNFSLSTFNFLRKKEMPRISFYYFWLPSALLTILISNRWLADLPQWQILKF